MKHLFTLKSLLLTLVMLFGLNAWGETYQHVFTAKPSTGDNVTLSGMSWTVAATNLNNYNRANYAGVQFGSSKANGQITLTSSSDWNYNEATEITEVRLWLNLGGTSVTPTVKIGGTDVASDGTKVTKNSTAGTDWTKTTKVTFTPSEPLSGVVVIDVTSVKAGYICAVEIDCQTPAGVVTVAKPTITETSTPDFGSTYLTTSTATATIAAAADVDAIKYAITDGEEPADWSVYSAEVSIISEVADTKTLWAKAVKGTDESAVVKQEFSFVASIANTKETALTTEQAKALIDKTSADQLAAEKVYVKGTISKIDSYNSTYKSITYWLDNDAFQVYSGKGLDNADFSAKTDLEIGASVIVYGNIKKYNSTYEFDKNNYLVKYTQVTVQSIAINGEATKTEYEAGETFSTAGLEVIATMSDGSTADVTSSAAWTFDPETLAVGTTTVKVTATYQEFSASKDVNVTVVAAIPSVTLDLTTTTQCTVETADKLEWNVSDIVTVTVDKASDSQTAANNYYPGAGNEYTRFYAKHSLTFTPAANYSIASITYNAKTTGYATALANSTWENATATADNKTVTIVPTDGTQPIVATISETTGATSMVIKYKEIPIATEEGLDAVLLGEVGKKYQINTTLRVNYTDAKYAYASTIGGGSTKTAPTEAQKEEWWSDVEKNFNQNDWVAIQNWGLEVGAEIEAGSVATLVSNDAFPVVEFVTKSHTSGTAIDANTYRVANFVDSDNELVKKLWLVDPQPAEHCFVKGYVASLDDVVEIDGVFVAEIKSGEKDVVTMLVNYNPTDFSITATGWYRFEGVVVNGTSGLELNAVNVNEGTATGVEGVETSSVKVYGAEGVINVESEEVAPIAVYSANGAIVSSVEASSASIAVAPGFYIVKAGNSVSKVTVK